MNFLNCKFDSVSESQALDWSRDWLKSGKRGYISTVNVAILMMMRSNPKLKQFVDDSALIVADGQPLIWLSRLIRKPLPERVAGVELMQGLARCAAEEGVSVFLTGAKRDVVEKVAQRLKNENPALIIAGVNDGYFTREGSAERAKEIRESGAGLLIVAMGVPRQEEFLQDNWEDLGVNLAIGVGGSFDVLAGKVKRAPVWMQKTGLEWFYRMCQEPRRLFKRYLVTNSQFMYFAFREIGHQLFSPRATA